jgi:hypothetical protein
MYKMRIAASGPVPPSTILQLESVAGGFMSLDILAEAGGKTIDFFCQ